MKPLSTTKGQLYGSHNDHAVLNTWGVVYKHISDITSFSETNTSEIP